MASASTVSIRDPVAAIMGSISAGSPMVTGRPFGYQTPYIRRGFGDLICLCAESFHRLSPAVRDLRCVLGVAAVPENPQWPIWAGVEPYEPATMPF